jgi:EAL domain-containing protein (putative c-di-GMP-specific phosphodiesterase class I)
MQTRNIISLCILFITLTGMFFSTFVKLSSLSFFEIITYPLLGLGLGYVLYTFYKALSKNVQLEREMSTVKKSVQELTKEILTLKNNQTHKIKELSKSHAMALQEEILNNLRFIKELMDTGIHLSYPQIPHPLEPETEKAISDMLMHEAPYASIHTKTEQLEILEKALTAHNIEMLMQPIVSLPQRQPKHFECFARLQSAEGDIFNPNDFLEFAEEKNLMRIVDNTLLFRAFQVIKECLKRKMLVQFFLNLSPSTLGDEFFFESLVDFLSSQKQIASHLVFELPYDQYISARWQMSPRMRILNTLGCKFSLEGVNDDNLDPNLLRSDGVVYLKIGCPDLLVLMQTHMNLYINLKRALTECRRHQIALIVCRIESESQLKESLDIHFDFGQGYLFGLPQETHF